MTDRYGASELATVPLLAVADLSLEHALSTLLSAAAAYGIRMLVRWIQRRADRDCKG